MKLLAELAGAHAGRAAVVIGGALSAPAEFKLCPADALHIGTNQHGSKLCKCDYNVSIDYDIQPVVSALGAPIISTRRFADYRIFKEPVPNSGMIAAWAAWVLGCAPIIIIGVDFYRNGTYFHDPDAKSVGKQIRPQMYLHRWSLMAKQAPGAMFRVLGGPLLDLFPLYNVREPVPAVALPAKLDSRVLRGTLVEVTGHIALKRTHTQKEVLPFGVHEVSPTEARQIVGARAGRIANGMG